MTKINELLKRLKIVPNNLAIFQEAITHPSYANEHKKFPSYQRLEFFGDALIQRHTSEFIFRKFPELDEGKMSILRSNIVSGGALARIARDVELEKYIVFGTNSDHLRDNDKVLEDAFEAFIAALYLDQGDKALKHFLSNFIFQYVRGDTALELQTKNPKTRLQEFLQADSDHVLEYRTTASSAGFEATVHFGGNLFGRGTGSTKKEAEITAAKNALKLLKLGLAREVS